MSVSLRFAVGADDISVGRRVGAHGLCQALALGEEQALLGVGAVLLLLGPGGAGDDNRIGRKHRGGRDQFAGCAFNHRGRGRIGGDGRRSRLGGRDARGRRFRRGRRRPAGTPGSRRRRQRRRRAGSLRERRPAGNRNQALGRSLEAGPARRVNRDELEDQRLDRVRLRGARYRGFEVADERDISLDWRLPGTQAVADDTELLHRGPLVGTGGAGRRRERPGLELDR